jgi:hypothetical protein
MLTEARNHDFAVSTASAGGRRGIERFERLERDRSVGVGVVVNIDAADVSLALVPIELVDVVLSGLVDVDGVFVDERLSGEDVDLADHARPVRRGVDDHDVLLRRRPQRNRRSGEVLVRPVPAIVAGAADEALLTQKCQERLRLARPEMLAGLEWELEAGRFEVGEQHVQVVGVQARLFGRRGEQELRVLTT